MNPSLWRDLLTRWNADLLQEPDIDEVVPRDVIAGGWLGYPGATEGQIAAAEARLGAALPPSYREFLRVSNGWRYLGWPHAKLWSTEDVDWFRARNRDWIDAWLDGARTQGGPFPVSDEQYFVYGEAQMAPYLRGEYLPSLLEVSDTGDGVIMLLNPRVVFPDSEWEAWDFGNWYPGAQRYRSFWEMMQGEYRQFLVLRDRETSR